MQIKRRSDRPFFFNIFSKNKIFLLKAAVKRNIMFMISLSLQVAILAAVTCSKCDNRHIIAKSECVIHDVG
jgi:hypothetical protein